MEKPGFLHYLLAESPRFQNLSQILHSRCLCHAQASPTLNFHLDLPVGPGAAGARPPAR